MTRINDNPRNEKELQEAVKQLALRVNQLERLLDGKDIYEAKAENNTLYYRSIRLTLNNGLSRSNWIEKIMGAVTSLVAGTGITLNPAIGIGDVTINNAGVTSAVAGTAISVSSATGAVTIANTGVTSAVAGAGITVSGATGAVTISSSLTGVPSTAGHSQYEVLQINGSAVAAWDWVRWV